MTTAITKRPCATAVVDQSGKILLIREKGDERFMLPGGPMGHGDDVLETALRRLRRQAGLLVSRAEFLFEHEGSVQLHKVVLIQADGRVHLQKWQIPEYKWWDRREPISLSWAARDIIDKYTKTVHARNPDGTRR